MSDQQDKIDKPHVHFDAPHEVVIDPALSKDQKKDALDALEQDARQLEMASAEGMGGGEPNRLRDVLHAREALELPPTHFAYDVVLQDLHARLDTETDLAAQSELRRAATALDALKPPHAKPVGSPAPGSEAEKADERARERLAP